MLQKVTIHSFRCLRDVSVPLKPLTVLIGPNDSGKSVFLKAIQHLAALDRNFAREDFWREEGEELRIEGETPGGAVIVTPTRVAGHSIGSAGFFQLPPGGVPMESGGYSDEAGPQELSRDGTGTAGLVDYFLRRDRERFDGFVNTLRALVPGLEKVDVATPTPDRRRLDFVIERGLKVRGHDVSAGLRLLVFFTALAFHPLPPKLILIEEPENGIHSKRLEDVINLLRDVTKGRHGGHAAQVILTTHSPYLLDLVRLEEDQVLVFRRNADGSRSADPADAARLKAFRDEFLLGEVWYNEGEAGLVKKGA